MLPVFAMRDMIDVLIMHVHFYHFGCASTFAGDIFVVPGCSWPSTRGHLTPLFPGFPGSLRDGDTSDGDHHYRKLRSEHVTGKFVRHVFNDAGVLLL
jgi:hypothetical protein